MELHFIEQIFDKVINPPKMQNQTSHIFITTKYNYAAKSATITSFDNVTIDLLILKKKASGLKRRPFLVYNHSHGSEKTEAFQLVDSCDKLGCDIALYDSRGCGKSSDTYVTFGHSERIDLLFVLFYILVTEQPNEFLFWGRSIGCCAVIQLVNMLTPDVKKAFRIDLVNKTATNKAISDKFKKSEILDENFSIFMAKNGTVRMSAEYASFTILGVILDSPIKSMASAVTNFIKSKILNVNFVASYISKYLNNYLEKKIKIDLKKNNNETAIKNILINSYLMFSMKDEFVSEEDEECIKKNYGSNADKRPHVYIKKLEVKHTSRRTNETIIEALKTIIQAQNNMSYSFFIDNVNSLNDATFRLYKADSLDSSCNKKSKFNTPQHHRKQSLLLQNPWGYSDKAHQKKNSISFFTSNSIKKEQPNDLLINKEIRPDNLFLNIEIIKKVQLDIKTTDSKSDFNSIDKAPNQKGSSFIEPRERIVEPQVQPRVERRMRDSRFYESRIQNIYDSYNRSKRDPSPIIQHTSHRNTSQQPIQMLRSNGSFIENVTREIQGGHHGGYSVDRVNMVNNSNPTYFTGVSESRVINSNRTIPTTPIGMNGHGFLSSSRTIQSNKSVQKRDLTPTIFREYDVNRAPNQSHFAQNQSSIQHTLYTNDSQIISPPNYRPKPQIVRFNTQFD